MVLVTKEIRITFNRKDLEVFILEHCDDVPVSFVFPEHPFVWNGTEENFLTLSLLEKEFDIK